MANHGYCKNCYWFNNFEFSDIQDKIKFPNGYCGMWRNSTGPNSYCPDYDRKKVKIISLINKSKDSCITKHF